MAERAETQQDRVLLLMPTQRDAERTAQLLREEINVASVICADMAQLCNELRVAAGAVLLTDDELLRDPRKQLADTLDQQPPWSSVPILMLAREGASQHIQLPAAATLHSVVVLERPVRTRALLSAVTSALRARRSQYQIRDALLERERQAAALEAQDEKLRFALAAGRLGSWELDLQTGELVCSDICKTNFGRAVDAPFSNDDLQAAVHPEDRARVDAAFACSLTAGCLYDVEYRVLWPNGEIHWVMVRGRAIYDRDEAVRMVGVSLDITERERLHEALRQSQAELARQADQLRTADRLKDEFLATLAHELRNPLAPITAGLALLAASRGNETANSTLGVMQRQVAHMVRLIDDLLDVSRITRGKLALKRERVELRKVIDAGIEGSLSAMQRGNHTLRVDIADEPLVLEADPTRMAQVISNLLNNASKYTAAGGIIELSAKREGDLAVITVDDTGYGIPADQIERVFEMFSQVNRALERSQGGLGIGLALVRRLVEMHDGTVTACSAGLDQGSRFTVRLPLASSGASLPEQIPAANVRPLEGKRILVVDDNQDAAEMLALMLERSGYSTTTAHDGHQAVAAARASMPDAIILDIGLPGMSGYEVAQRMRQDPLLASAVLIALTGWGTQEDKRKALAAGFDLHMTKPVDVDDLQRNLVRIWQERALERTG
jgi:signal transduction histidine kinase/CheY-like chemotaxis protein